MAAMNFILMFAMLVSILVSKVLKLKRRTTDNNNPKFHATISLKTFYVALASQAIVGALCHFLVIYAGRKIKDDVN